MAIHEERHYQGHPRAPHNVGAARLAGALGWFSIGVGLSEILMPDRVAHMIGIHDRNGKRALLRIYGIREIATGIGILSRSNPSGWLWGRVAGDMVDLGSLGWLMGSRKMDRSKASLATAAVLGVTMLDVYCGHKLSPNQSASPDGFLRMTKTIIINRSPAEVYAFWHNFENFVMLTPHLESVQDSGNGRSLWKMNAPAGKRLEWESQIEKDQPHALITWRSVKGADIDHSGSVHFERATGGRGTLVRVHLAYAPPGGAMTAQIARLFGVEPGQQVENALRRMKQILETGSMIRSDADIRPGLRPAQPPAHQHPGAASGGVPA